MQNITNPTSKVKKEQAPLHPTSSPILPRRYGGEDGERSDTSLPCLYSNNSIENPVATSNSQSTDYVLALGAVLSPYHKRQAESLYLNVTRLIEKEAISPNHVGFLTLTFKDNVTDHKEASRRLNSLLTNFIKPHQDFGYWVCTKEQQARGAWHFHFVICMSEDIKTGVSFEELANRKYTSASPYLKRIWKELREAMPKYGFGRPELLPVKSNAEAMGRYIGKYISKHIGQRDEKSKGAKLITYSRGWAKNSMKFSWNTDNAKAWREKVSWFAKIHGCTEFYQLSEKLGSNWAYKYAQEIFDIEPLEHRVNGVKEKEYTPALLERIKANKPQSMEDKTSPFTSQRRKDNRKKEKSRGKVDLLKAKIPKYICEELTSFLANEMAEEREKETALRQSYKEKQGLSRIEEHQGQTVNKITGEIISQSITQGVPF